MGQYNLLATVCWHSEDIYKIKRFRGLERSNVPSVLSTNPDTQRAAPPPSGENMPKTFDSTSPAKCENLAFVVPLRLLCELAPTCRPPALSRTFPAARFAFWTAPPEHKPLFNMATEQRTLSASCNSACKSDINASRQVSRHRRLASALPISPSRLSPM
jgi:hypothetical protein